MGKWGDDTACVVFFQGCRYHRRASELGRPGGNFWGPPTFCSIIKMLLNVPQLGFSSQISLENVTCSPLSDIPSTYQNIQGSEKHCRKEEFSKNRGFGIRLDSNPGLPIIAST